MRLYTPTEYALLGGWIALGALTGDLVESAIKRIRGLDPGASFMPWDGIDYIVGALVFLSVWYIPSIWEGIFLLLISPLLSKAANTISFFLGWKKVPY